MRFGSRAPKFSALQHAGIIVAGLSAVPGTESPGRACLESARDLSAGQDVARNDFYFSAGSREVGDFKQSIGGIEADADNIDDRVGGGAWFPKSNASFWHAGNLDERRNFASMMGRALAISRRARILTVCDKFPNSNLREASACDK